MSLLIGDNAKSSLWRKNKVLVILKTGRFDNLDTAIIISSVSEAVQSCTLLMMSVESMLSKRPLLQLYFFSV